MLLICWRVCGAPCFFAWLQGPLTCVCVSVGLVSQHVLVAMLDNRFCMSAASIVGVGVLVGCRTTGLLLWWC
jgi:hypothetical protein